MSVRRQREQFEWAVVGGYALLIVHAIRRHKLLFALIWAGVVGLSLGLMAALPKTYDVQTTLQVSRAQVISALSSRSTPLESDAPDKRAAETVFRHENLVALVHQTDLVERWPRTRAPLLRVKDMLWQRIFPRQSEEDQLESFVGLLEKKLWVSTSEGTVTIGVHFPDAQLAFQIVEAALQNFLEARHVLEISAIGDAIAILEARTDQAQEALDESVRHLQDVRQGHADAQGRRVARRPTEMVLPTTSPDRETSQLAVQIQAKRRAIADLEEFRRRRTTELQARLEEQKVLYSENHPLVLDTRQSLEALHQESPQIQALRRDLVPLEAEIKQRGLLPDVPLKASRVRNSSLKAAALEPVDPNEDQNPEIDYAKSQLRHALARYNGLEDRTDAARLELDSAQAAFKYRYVLIRPAQRPRGPVSPNPALIFLSSLVAGLFLATIGPALVDLLSRRFVEPWQIEHTLGVPLLGELRDL
jgi:uncharacterized protein involved in exopolysaccharide biosynthesis